MKHQVIAPARASGSIRFQLVCCLALAVLFQTITFGQGIPGIFDDSYGYQLSGPAGAGLWWCEATYKVGRERAVPLASGFAVEISAARNEYEPFQIVLKPDSALSNLTIAVSDFVRIGSPADMISSTNVEVCLVEYVPVIEPTDVLGAPGDWPDPILPLVNAVTVSAGINQPFWFTVHVPKNAPSGEYEATVTFMADGMAPFDATVQLHVFNFSLSDVTHTDTAYYVHVHDGTWNKLTTQADQRLGYDLYMQDYRRHRVSPYSAHLYSPIIWQLVGTDFVVDFADFDEAMTRYLDEFDFTAFNLFGRKSPEFPASLGGYAAFTPEYQVLLAKLMKKVMAHLREKGWADKAYCLWYDEPPVSVYPHYFAGMDAVQLAAPDLRRLGTLNVAPWNFDSNLYGRVDIWTPVESGATDSMYLDRKSMGEENWWYVATGPRYPFPNLFIDHPAINHRIRYWAAEKYGITGDLYWAVNYWSLRNPWEETRTFLSYEANGDGVLLYPPTKAVPIGPVLASPTDSIRWELTREALEDAEYFWLVKELMSAAQLRIGPDHPAVLEGENALAAAMGLVTNIANYSEPQYTQNPQEIYAARERLAHAIEALGDGAPFFVKEPHSQAVALGGTVTLRSEALGWPNPSYQWQFSGLNLAGETNSYLVLDNCGLPQEGSYTVVASNSAGVAASSAARIGGYWSDMPCILVHPSPVVQYEGEKAVMTVTAISTNELSYQWLQDGIPVAGAVATNAALLLTNLTASLSGNYSVVIGNSEGSVTSQVARLTVLWNPRSPQDLISTGGSWRYHDLGVDFGMAWCNVGFDDSGWMVGSAPFGFGNGGESTILDTNAPTVYFRKSFELAEAPAVSPLSGQFRADDGIAVYLNGAEVFRYNLPEGGLAYETSASVPVEGVDENTWLTFSIPANSWLLGTNVIAVEIHQYTGPSTQPPEPVAFWTMDESASPWADQIGGHNFVEMGAGIGTQPGKVDGCVTNRIGSSWLQAADAPELRYSGPFTVGGWFAGVGSYWITPSAVTCLGKPDEFRLYYTGTATNRYRFQVGNVEVQDTTSIKLNQWRFVVGWYDGTNAFLQVDSGPVHSVAVAPPAVSINALVALKPEGSVSQFAEDEVFMYKRVLSAAERTAIYTTGLREVLNPPPAVTDLAFDFAASVELAQEPQIVESPMSLVRYEGQHAAFQAKAVSSTPMSYQWMFDGTAIPGANEPLLFISGVAPQQAGLYALKVGNLGGASSSDSASLNVLDRPNLKVQWPPVAGAGLELLVPASTASWSLLGSTNLLDWSVLATVPPGTEPTVVVDAGATNAPVRFYRLRLD